MGQDFLDIWSANNVEQYINKLSLKGNENINPNQIGVIYSFVVLS